MKSSEETVRHEVVDWHSVQLGANKNRTFSTASHHDSLIVFDRL